MKRYYFDMCEDGDIAVDDEGMELRALEAVQGEAARTLADMTRDAMRRGATGAEQRMSIDVRDDAGLVLQLKCTLAVVQLKH